MSRRVAYPGILVLVVLALSSLFLIGPRSGTKAQTMGACCSQQEIGPREIVFPYFSLADGFSSTLLLVSDSPKPLNFILATHSLGGQTALSNTMTIQPGAKLSIDMRQLLTSLGADVTGTFSQGSVSIYFEGTIMPLVGQMTIVNPARHWVQQAVLVENDPGRTDIPAVLSGQWWGLSGGRDATIMVTNASGNSVTADIFLAYAGKEHKAQPLIFNPNETKLLSVAGMLNDLNMSVAQAPEGRITIIQRGTNPSLVAQGRVTDPITGFSTTLDFPDPGRQHASADHATGIPVGTPPLNSPFAGDGTFTPHVIASNMLSKPQAVTITIEYPKGSHWNSVERPGGPDVPTVFKPVAFKLNKQGANKSVQGLPPSPDPASLTGQFTLGPLTVAADTTVDFSLAAEMNQLPLPLPYASVRIQYSGPPGSVIAQVSSVDENQNLVVDARAMNEGDGWAGSGANPWHLDKSTQSILFLTDEGDKPVRIGFSVTVGGIHYYLTQLALAPHETRAIDFRKLRDAQAPDAKKDMIPAGATDGGVTWIRLDDFPVVGRVAVISKQNCMASSYDCCICPCPATFVYGSFLIQPASFTLVAGYGLQCEAYAYFATCNGYQTWTELDVWSTSWSSGDTSVAVIDSSVAGQIDGVGGGSTHIYGLYTGCDSYQFPACSCLNYVTEGGSSNVTVQQPEYVGVGNAMADSVECGTTNYYTRRLLVPYTVLDSNKSPIAKAGINVHEQLSWTSNVCTTSNDCGLQPNAATWSTNSSGGFTDTIYNCSPTCENNGTCSEDWQQTFTYNGNPLGIVNGSTVGTLNCITTDCSSTPQGVTH